MKKIFITESQMKNLVNEVKGDNLHQFVEYITKFGQNGTLSSNENVDSQYIKSQVKYIGNDIFNSQDYEDFLNDNEYDYFDDSHQNEYEEIVLERTVAEILKYLNINERGLIYVERNIRIPYFSNNGRIMDDFANRFDGHLGEYWSYLFGQIVDPNGKGDDISFKGWVRPEDVNWTETINTNLTFPEEYELRLELDAPVEIDKITAVSKKTINNENSEFTIWNRPIIMKV